MKTKTFLLGYVCMAVTALQVQNQAHPAKVQPHATLKGNLIQLHPSGFRFKVPQRWIEWNQKFHNNFQLSRPQIERNKLVEGEWDEARSHILLSLFPIEQCAVHAGGEGWGLNSAGISDVQMRAYVGSWTPSQIQALVRTKGIDSASKFAVSSTDTGFATKSFAEGGPTFHSKRVGAWQVSQLEYRLWYGDYGGTARIDIYARIFGKQTAALAFMYVDGSEEAEIASIVNSFRPLHNR